jgi:hypothetical protein
MVDTKVELKEDLKDVFSDIERNGLEIAKASDLLRTKLRLLCGAVYKSFKTSAEAKAFISSAHAWREIFLESDTLVRCEGTLVHFLKKAGVEFVSSRPFFEEVHEPKVSFFLSFGKFNGLWQFYVSSYSEFGDDDGFGIDNVSRDLLPSIVQDLPRFINEFSKYVEGKKKEYLTFSKYADTLDQQFAFDV